MRYSNGFHDPVKRGVRVRDALTDAAFRHSFDLRTSWAATGRRGDAFPVASEPPPEVTLAKTQEKKKKKKGSVSEEAENGSDAADGRRTSTFNA